MYRFEAPRNHDQAMAIDQCNDSTKWAGAEGSEVSQANEHNNFKDIIAINRHCEHCSLVSLLLNR